MMTPTNRMPCSSALPSRVNRQDGSDQNSRRVIAATLRLTSLIKSQTTADDADIADTGNEGPTSLLKLDGREAERKQNLGQIFPFYT